MPTEPRYATEEWRWVTSEDGLRNKLVAGPELLPLPRVVLACGGIDAEDEALISAAPQLYRELVATEKLLSWMDEWGRLGEVAMKRLESTRAVLAAARGQEVPDGQ